MIIADVKKLSPEERFTYWINEREAIRIKKEAGEPKPWTTDVILQRYRFCNIRRMDDKVSRWLLENWYKPNFNSPSMVAATAIARFVNLPSSLGRITDLVFHPNGPRWSQIKSKLRAIMASGNSVFNGAYVVRGNDGMDKIASVIDWYVRPMFESPVEVDADSMENTWQAIYDCYGFGSFMAGQVTADLRWAIKGRWLDAEGWAPMGPGSQRGLHRILGSPDIRKQWKPTEFKEELAKLSARASIQLPMAITGKLEGIDWQNCLCETDKYNRVLLGEGKPKQKYNGT